MVNSKLTVYGSETVACHPAGAEWRQKCIAPAGNNPREVIHITLQDLFWVLSIIWLICQIIDWLRNGKK